MKKGLIGKKLGMTQVFAADGRWIPVTVVEAGPCIVLQKKTVATDGYDALQLGFGATRHGVTVRLIAGEHVPADHAQFSSCRHDGHVTVLFSAEAAEKVA